MTSQTPPIRSSRDTCSTRDEFLWIPAEFRQLLSLTSRPAFKLAEKLVTLRCDGGEMRFFQERDHRWNNKLEQPSGRFVKQCLGPSTRDASAGVRRHHSRKNFETV